MNVQELLATARDMVSVKRVFGDPVERDGVLVIPVAVVRGGGGGGGGQGPATPGGGGGGGFGMWARPIGAYVVKDGQARFVPAIDVGALAVTGLVGLMVVGRVVVRRLSRRWGPIP